MKHHNRRCKKWALTGSDYCAFHGGRKKKPVNLSHLPMFYSVHLNTTLQEAVEQMLNVAPEEQLNLFEELALMRVAAGQAVALYNAAIQSGKENLKTEASCLMSSALQDVVKTCEAASRVANAGKDKISVHDVQYVVHQIVRVAYECMEEEDAHIFEDTIRSKVKIPGLGTAKGTNITPDMDVKEMDATIPYVE